MQATVKQIKTENRFCDSKGRLYFYDNAKFILILLVVLAHFLSPFKDVDGNEYLKYAWKFVNTLHMPCLIFISGFFAKRYIQKNGELKVQRTFSYFTLFIVAQIAVSLFEYFVLDTPLKFSALSARTSLWFLQCLAVWYLVLPFFAKFKPQVVLPVSIVIGLLIGYDNSAFNIIAISRVFVHFPFFIAGYYCTPEAISKLFAKSSRVLGAVLFAASLVLFLCLGKFQPDGIITCNYPYSMIVQLKSVPAVWHWVYRLCFYALAIILCASFLAIVPRRKTFFTRFGSRTLQVYILHRFLYLAWLEFAWWEFFNDIEFGKTIVFILSIALTLVLSIKPFSYPFTALQSIKINGLLIKNKVKKQEE